MCSTLECVTNIVDNFLEGSDIIEEDRLKKMRKIDRRKEGFYNYAYNLSGVKSQCAVEAYNSFCTDDEGCREEMDRNFVESNEGMFEQYVEETSEFRDHRPPGR